MAILYVPYKKSRCNLLNLKVNSAAVLSKNFACRSCRLIKLPSIYIIYLTHTYSTYFWRCWRQSFYCKKFFFVAYIHTYIYAHTHTQTCGTLNVCQLPFREYLGTQYFRIGSQKNIIKVIDLFFLFCFWKATKKIRAKKYITTPVKFSFLS